MFNLVICVNKSLMLNTFNTIVFSYKSIPSFSFYFIVGLRTNQRLYPILG